MEGGTNASDMFLASLLEAWCAKDVDLKQWAAEFEQLISCTEITKNTKHVKDSLAS